MIELLKTITFWVAIANIAVAVGGFFGRIIQLELRKRGFFHPVHLDLRMTEVEWRRA